MNWKKIVNGLIISFLIILLVFFVVTNPDGAADFFQSLWADIKGALVSVTRFLSQLTAVQSWMWRFY
jgi:hypothetical protein